MVQALGGEQKRKVRLFFQDEAGFGRISDLRQSWAPEKMRPEVKKQIVREYLFAFSAVCPADGSIFSMILPYEDSHVMSVFLDGLSREYPDEMIVMVLDGAGWHTGGELVVPKNIKLLPLPPYSPELNPTEHIWDWIRENYFANKLCDSLDEVEERLCKALKELADNNDLVKGMTGFPWIIPICMTSN